MAITKRISSDYLITSNNGQPTTIVVGTETANNAEVTINGNLTVLGKNTNVVSTDLVISDNIITLNAGVGNVAPTLDAGITVDRGTESPAEVRWNESVDAWQLFNGVFYSNILVEAGGYITSVHDDPSPMLGGNLNVGTYAITSSSDIVLVPISNVKIMGNLSVTNTSTSNQSIISSGPVSGGGTGTYVTNGTVNNEELVSKSKAIVYSLIF